MIREGSSTAFFLRYRSFCKKVLWEKLLGDQYHTAGWEGFSAPIRQELRNLAPLCPYGNSYLGTYGFSNTGCSKNPLKSALWSNTTFCPHTSPYSEPVCSRAMWTLCHVFSIERQFVQGAITQLLSEMSKYSKHKTHILKTFR
jgi:hypothetical protein